MFFTILRACKRAFKLILKLYKYSFKTMHFEIAEIKKDIFLWHFERVVLNESHFKNLQRMFHVHRVQN